MPTEGRHDFHWGETRKCRDRLERGLSCCAKDDSDGAVLRERLDGVEDRREKAVRKRLCLIQDDHAAREVVDLSRGRPPIRKQTVEKLHGSGHDYWRVPVFGGKSLPHLIWGEILAWIDSVPTFERG